MYILFDIAYLVGCVAQLYLIYWAIKALKRYIRRY